MQVLEQNWACKVNIICKNEVCSLVDFNNFAKNI